MMFAAGATLGLSCLLYCSVSQVKRGKELQERRERRREIKSAAPGLPAWSPTAVLPGSNLLNFLPGESFGTRFVKDADTHVY
eukprot:scaffold76718_cov75-Phaeocystis_antarctica.AAC.1